MFRRQSTLMTDIAHTLVWINIGHATNFEHCFLASFYECKQAYIKKTLPGTLRCIKAYVYVIIRKSR